MTLTVTRTTQRDDFCGVYRSWARSDILSPPPPLTGLPRGHLRPHPPPLALPVGVVTDERARGDHDGARGAGRAHWLVLPAAQELQEHGGANADDDRFEAFPAHRPVLGGLPDRQADAGLRVRHEDHLRPALEGTLEGTRRGAQGDGKLLHAGATVR